MAPNLSPFLDALADLQQQIKSNHALVQSIREELRREELRRDQLAQSASSTPGHRSPSILSLRGQEVCTLGTWSIWDSRCQYFTVFAKKSSMQGTMAQEASFRHPTNVDLDVELYHGPKWTLMHRSSQRMSIMWQSYYNFRCGSFRNMSEQLLSSEGEARSTSSLPPSHSVAHWLKETNSRIRGYEDTEVLKQHKDSLQAHHKGMVDSEVFILHL